jgi:hypothetical protein
MAQSSSSVKSSRQTKSSMTLSSTFVSSMIKLLATLALPSLLAAKATPSFNQDEQVRTTGTGTALATDHSYGSL